jgi:hypothetical protein
VVVVETMAQVAKMVALEVVVAMEREAAVQEQQLKGLQAEAHLALE